MESRDITVRKGTPLRPYSDCIYKEKRLLGWGQEEQEKYRVKTDECISLYGSLEDEKENSFKNILRTINEKESKNLEFSF